MTIERLDEIFQLKSAVPIIAGMYIGMDEESAAEKLDELISYKRDHSGEYPADLIYTLGLSFEYELFDNEPIVRVIRVIFPKEFSNADFQAVKNYLIKKYYHEKTHEDMEKDFDGNLLKAKTTIYNYYYQFAIQNREDEFVIQITGIVLYPHLYKTFYLMATKPELKSFIQKSLFFCPTRDDKDKDLDRLFPVHNGFPLICGQFLGLQVNSAFEAEEMMGSIIKDPNMLIENVDYRGISFEAIVEWDCRIDQIFMRISSEDVDIALKIMHHLKERLLVETANYNIQYDEDGKLCNMDVSMENEFISVKFKSPYSVISSVEGIEISIESVKKDCGELYEALYDMLNDSTHYGYFKAAKEFYKDGNDTHDAKFNELRKRFETYKEGVEEFIAWHEGLAHDMGGYLASEEEADRERFLSMWNTPGAELPTIW